MGPAHTRNVMLKAVVGIPDSSGMVKATVQSGPVIPDSFCIPVSPQVSQMSAVQKHVKVPPVIFDKMYHDEMLAVQKHVKVPPVISDKRYHDEIALENAKFDASERLRHKV